jgi:rare lipoprotein A
MKLSIRQSLFPLLTLVLFLQACGTTSMTRNAVGTFGNGLSRGSTIQAGVASWYGPDFHGKKTANGETYDMDDLTAAHKTLPFNTVVRVENLDNGRSVVVRINDRGPYVGNRVIDLSRKAAQEIQMIGPGTARVRLVLLEKGDAPVHPSTIRHELFTVQIGSFESRKEARQKASTLRGSSVEQRVANGKTVYRVYYGAYKSRDKAERMLRRLKARGIQGYVKQYQN